MDLYDLYAQGLIMKAHKSWAAMVQLLHMWPPSENQPNIHTFKFARKGIELKLTQVVMIIADKQIVVNLVKSDVFFTILSLEYDNLLNNSISYWLYRV